jgi:hypothetical protein
MGFEINETDQMPLVKPMVTVAFGHQPARGPDAGFGAPFRRTCPFADGRAYDTSPLPANQKIIVLIADGYNKLVLNCEYMGWFLC